METSEALEALLRSIAVPLITIDRATLHLVKASPSRVHLHLGGAYSGCPGTKLVEKTLLAPLVKDVFPSAELEVTSGQPIPTGSKALT